MNSRQFCRSAACSWPNDPHIAITAVYFTSKCTLQLRLRSTDQILYLGIWQIKAVLKSCNHIIQLPAGTNHIRVPSGVHSHLHGVLAPPPNPHPCNRTIRSPPGISLDQDLHSHMTIIRPHSPNTADHPHTTIKPRHGKIPVCSTRPGQMYRTRRVVPQNAVSRRHML
jgi:hypothetical protein